MVLSNPALSRSFLKKTFSPVILISYDQMFIRNKILDWYIKSNKIHMFEVKVDCALLRRQSFCKTITLDVSSIQFLEKYFQLILVLLQLVCSRFSETNRHIDPKIRNSVLNATGHQ